jgi:hypothetical protein
LVIFRESGERAGEVYALNGLGEAAHTAGRPADALAHHTDAHTMAVDIGARDQQARAHHTLGNPAGARESYRQALTLYTDLGVSQADQIRAHLAALDHTDLERQ